MNKQLKTWDVNASVDGNEFGFLITIPGYLAKSTARVITAILNPNATIIGDVEVKEVV